MSQQTLFTGNRRETAWFDAQPDDFCIYFLDYIKKGGFYLIFFNIWVQVQSKLSQKHSVIFLPRDIDISGARYLWLYSAWHKPVKSAQIFGHRYITLWLLLLYLLLLPSVTRHVLLSQSREDSCVCVKKGIKRVGEGDSHPYFLLHIIFFIPKKRKSTRTK